MKFITPHDCMLALMPPPCLTIRPDGIWFNETATIQLALNEGTKFKIGIDTNDDMWFGISSRDDYFKITGKIGANAFCTMPGLFQFLELDLPTSFSIWDMKNGLHPLMMMSEVFMPEFDTPEQANEDPVEEVFTDLYELPFDPETAFVASTTANTIAEEAPASPAKRGRKPGSKTQPKAEAPQKVKRTYKKRNA